VSRPVTPQKSASHFKQAIPPSTPNLPLPLDNFPCPNPVNVPLLLQVGQ